MYDLHGMELNFIHKRIIRGIGGFIEGGPVGAARGFVGGGGNGHLARAARCKIQRMAYNTGTGRCEPQMSIVARDTREACAARGGSWSTSRAECDRPPGLPPQVERPGALGAIQRALPGGFSGYVDADAGQALMGQYGAGLAPNVIATTRRDCSFGGQVRGMILGSDGLCYNKGQISNKERFWPRGRRPLLSGGEMRAISIAARAASRVQRTTAKLESIGMLKKKSSGGYLPRK